MIWGRYRSGLRKTGPRKTIAAKTQEAITIRRKTIFLRLAMPTPLLFQDKAVLEIQIVLPSEEKEPGSRQDLPGGQGASRSGATSWKWLTSHSTCEVIQSGVNARGSLARTQR